MSSTEAQEEFQSFVDKNSGGSAEDRNVHPEDRAEHRREEPDSLDEEDEYRARQVDEAMRIPGSNGFNVQLPPASFDSGRATGVKGVIADARSYETARKSSWVNRVRQSRRSVFSGELNFDSNGSNNINEKSDSDEDPLQDEEEETFLAQWRESRRRELEDESRPGIIVHTRRTSPSARIYGRLDTVDALGYLDAIEKVGHETVVVVFVYDNEVGPTLPAACLCTSRSLLTLPVSSIVRGRVGATTTCQCKSYGALCQGSLRRHRIRQRRCPVHTRLPQPRRPDCEPDWPDRAASRRRRRCF